jgi:hypothetical protein
LTISELAGALREVNVTLEQTRATTASALPLLAESRAILHAVIRDPNGYRAVDLDLAMSELGSADEKISRARQLILDYLMRL